ncbi:PREDICTED: A-kinase anchor protein 17B-like [Chrysochloris asiatica]|uniref:A-kinase anchor protein 17B-like n=1 Tax=Chrysochloris asiatica TaxID=185453 RepID=A0A9B0TXK3_CHRAS|nr:PREDICTED: A-kinase anchor protein 17B-like [Chrysochloris asiatica]
MTVTVVYDNSEATELCAAQHLYLKPIAKLTINVLLPESTEPVRPFSNWEVLDQLKSLICPDQFTTVRLSKSTKDFIRFEGEAETLSLVQILKAKLHGKIIKLNGLKTDLKVVATDAQREWEHFPKVKEPSLSDGTEEQDHDKSPDAIYFEGLPCKWFAPKGSSGEKPCEEILRVVFESFGKIKNVDIPMLDPYREVMTGGTFGSLSYGLQTFEAFIQYQELTDYVKAMESLRGMKLMLKGDDGKALACNIKVMFDTTKHFSEGAIRKRNQERLKLQELEEERKKEKKREEEEAERKRKEERKMHEKRRKPRVKRRVLKERDRHRRKKHKDKGTAEVSQDPDSSEEWKERTYLLALRHVEALRLLRILLRKIAVSKSDDQLSSTDGESHLLEENDGYQGKDPESKEKSQVSSPDRSVGLALEWKDALEEISSDSECFNETLSNGEQENSVAVYHSSPEKRPLDSDKIVSSDQEARSGQQILYSKCKQDGEKKHSKCNFRKPDQRSKCELRYPWLEDEDDSFRDKKSNSKKREKPGPRYLLDEGYYHRSSSIDLLEDIAKKRRRFNGTTFDQKVNYRPSHVPMTSARSANAFCLRDFSRKRVTPWKSKYNQDERRSKRHGNSENFMLNSGSDYVRHKSQEDIDYGNYLGNSYTSSLYFQMF